MKNRFIVWCWRAVVAFWMAQITYPIECIATEEILSLPHETIGILELKTIKEPSGICYHTQRKTFFMVDDSGVVCEFTSDGKMVQEKKVRPADFEGVTHDPATGFLYIVIEGAESILEVDPETLECKREFAVPRIFQGETVMKQGGQGIEAITFAPGSSHPHGGTFFVANQSFNLQNPEDISAIFELELPLKEKKVEPGAVKIVRFFKVDIIDLSGLHYDSTKDLLYVISDFPNRIMAYSRMGQMLGMWTLPGDNQEGITVDPDGIMYIAQDSGGVLKLKIDWQDMEK